MKLIKKNSAPAELIAYKSAAGANYKDLIKNHPDVADVVRLSLADEQGYICCYCGRRIDGITHTRIEHIFPKSIPAFQPMELDYENNLLAACDGGKQDRKADPTKTPNDLFCDVFKDDKIIPMHPLNPVCENKFMYDANGDIIGIGSDAEVTISLLNLNSVILRNKRKAAIKYYTDYPVSDWKSECERLSSKDSSGKFEEFCFVLQRYIEFFHSDCL